MNNKVACKGFNDDYSDICEFNGTWLCKNPDCKSPVLTSTVQGAHPSGCPLVDKWNSKEAERALSVRSCD